MKKILYKIIIIAIIIIFPLTCLNLNSIVYADGEDNFGLDQYESWKDIPLERFQNPGSLEEAEALSKFLEGVNYADLTEEELADYSDKVYYLGVKLTDYTMPTYPDWYKFIASIAGGIGAQLDPNTIYKLYLTEKYKTSIYKNPLTTGQANQVAENVTPDTIIGDAETFIKDGQDSNIATINQENADTVLNSIYNIMLAIGITVTVIWGLIIAIKLMMSSVEEKAEYKKLLWPYLVGCIVIFGSFIIWKIVIIVMNNVM